MFLVKQCAVDAVGNERLVIGGVLSPGIIDDDDFEGRLRERLLGQAFQTARQLPGSMEGRNHNGEPYRTGHWVLHSDSGVSLPRLQTIERTYRYAPETTARKLCSNCEDGFGGLHRSE